MPTLFAGGRGIDVTMTQVGRKIRLDSRYHKPLIAEIKAMSGAKWDAQSKSWSVSDNARNALQLAMLQGETPEEIARYERPLGMVTPNRACLRSHQLAMLQHLMGRKRCILAAEMRTGKTLAVIEGMEIVGGDWVYVAPAGVLAAIRLELRKWAATNLPRLVSYAGLANVLSEWTGPAPRGVVFDESSRLKNADAIRTRAAQHLANEVRAENDDGGYVWELTGTPAPLCPVDWWAQAEVACPGFLRESTAKKLEQRLGTYGPEEFNATTGRAFRPLTGWKTDEVDLLSQRLVGLVQVHLLRDCLDVPEIEYERIHLPPNDETKRAARMLAETADGAASAMAKCRQLSDGFQYDAVGNATRCGTPKDSALVDLLEAQGETGRVIIYTAFRDSIDRVSDLCEAAGWLVLRRDGRGWKAPKDWTAEDALQEMDRATDTGTIPRLAFLANPGSGGMGLTLSAASCAIYYSQDFNGESRMQSVERGRYPGADRGFRVYDLCHLPTDELVLDNLSTKRDRQALTLNQIKEALSC
jgi:SNF2 family DNA or RNA helicase